MAQPGHTITWEVTTASEVTRLSLVGNAEQLGQWNVEKSILLSYRASTGKGACMGVCVGACDQGACRPTQGPVGRLNVSGQS